MVLTSNGTPNTICRIHLHLNAIVFLLGTIRGPDIGNNDYLGPAIEDEAENELHAVLHKARKLKQKKERKKQAPSADQKVIIVIITDKGRMSDPFG